MLDFGLSFDEDQIVKTVRAFVTRELFPVEERLLKRGIGSVETSPGLTHEELATLQGRAKESGLWGVTTPERFGGVDLSPTLQALTNLELGRTFVDFRFGGEAWSMLYLCDQDQEREYLLPVIEGTKRTCVAISEPGGGSDVRAMRTTAVRHGGDFVINGEKMWISHALDADFAVVLAKTPEEGDPNGITCFLVDKEAGWTASHIPTMGATGRVASISFTDVRVPARNVLGTINDGFSPLISWVYDNRLLRLAPRFVGAGERMLQMGIEWAEQRRVFGRPLSEFDNWRLEIAECDIALRAGKLLTLQGAWKATNGMDYRHEAYVAKAYTARMANQIVDKMIQLHGGMGYAMELPLERWYRDLRVARIYEGADEVNLAGIARNLFKRNAAPGGVFDGI